MSKLLTNAPHSDITYRITGAAMAVHNDLGPGHREVVYHRGMVAKMPRAPFNLSFEDEPKLPIYDEDGVLVYTYNPDFIAEQVVITEIKAQTHPLTNDDIAQVIDYFAACPHCAVALLINFGRPRLEWKRLFPPKHIQEHRRQKWGPLPK
jgi:GxxExxY protein